MPYKVALHDASEGSFPQWFSHQPARKGRRNKKMAFTDPSSFQRTLKPRATVMVRNATDELLLQAQLPGLQAVDIDLEIAGQTLILRGERRKAGAGKAGRADRRRQNYGLFQRTFCLPTSVQQEGIDAIFQKGVLTVKIPKSGSRF